MLSARICIRPVLSPFLYFPYAGLTYPILLYSRISLVALPQLISFWCRWTTVPTTLLCRFLLPGNGITRGDGSSSVTTVRFSLTDWGGRLPDYTAPASASASASRQSDSF